MNAKLVIIIFLLSIAGPARGQRLSREQAVQTALQNNPSIHAAESQVDYFRQMKKTGTDMGKMSATLMHGQYNSVYQDNNFTLSQGIPFPTTLVAQVKLGKEEVIGSQKNLVATQNSLAFDVKTAYEQLVYQEALRNLLNTQDSLFTDFSRASSLRYKTGESNLLEKTSAETQLLEIRNQVRMNDADIRILQTRLQALLKSDAPVESNDMLRRLAAPDVAASLSANPQLGFLQQQVVVSHQLRSVERNKILPDFMIGYFTQSLTGIQNINGTDTFFSRDKRFNGFSVGLAIPLWTAPQIARAKAASFQEEVARKNAESFELTLKGAYEQAAREFDKNEASLHYYEGSALQNADLILSQAKKAYRGGEIGYIEYLQSLRSALGIKGNYLIALHQYNLSIIKLEFILGKI
jgi:cobalt-zinc-cadmium resistance protein CzcA